MGSKLSLILCCIWLIHCEPSEGQACRNNFTELLQQLGQGQNLQQLELLFFSSDNPPPSLVTVLYQYLEENSTELSNETLTEVWLWANSPFYFYHPPQVFLFSSLLFSDTSLQLYTLNLNLSYDCYAATASFMKMLTQKLQLIASNANPTLLYQKNSLLGTAVAISRNIEEGSDEKSSSTTYLYASFIAIPITTYILILMTAVYLTDKKLTNFTGKYSGEKKKQYHLTLQNRAILSLAAVFYILSLSAASVYQAIQTSHYFKKYPSFIHVEQDALLVASSISTVTLILDAMVALLALICLIIMTCTRNIWKYSNYSFFFPLCCTVNHSCFILAACIHNIWHTISVVAIYILAGTLISATLTQVSHLVDKRTQKKFRHRMTLHLVAKLVVFVLLCGYISLIAVFYTFLPVRRNSVYFPGPLNLVNIATVSAVLVALLYFWATSTPRSFLWILAEAETQRRRSNHDDPWHKKTTSEQELAIARALLLRVLPSSSKQSNTDNTAPQEGQRQGEGTDGLQDTTSFTLQEIPTSTSDAKKK